MPETSLTPSTPPGALARLVLNLGLYPLLALWTIACLVFCLPLLAVLLTAVGWPKAKCARLLIWLYGRGAMLLFKLFMPVRREGMAAIPEPCILVANHQSIWDLYCMGLLPIFNVSMVVRDWPFKIPIFAMFMRLAGYIRIEEAKPGELLRKGGEILASGGSILFFPEGHRSRSGQLGRFHSGAFKLAVEAGVPVVPLCIEGTGRLLPPERIFLHPGSIIFRLLPPVGTKLFHDGETAHIEMKRHVKALMSDALDESRRGRIHFPAATSQHWRSV